MSKSIYDEALQESKDFGAFVGLRLDRVNNALKQAKKQEELLERLYNVCKEYKHMSIGLSDDSDFINIMNDIEKLENE